MGGVPYPHATALHDAHALAFDQVDTCMCVHVRVRARRVKCTM